MAQSSLQSLSVGKVVTTAFQLYKNRFQPYFLLALKAYFWLLVPVYGWAKFCATSALISRLVYGELVNQPETIKDGTRYVNSKLWQFLIAAVILGVIVIVWYIGLTILSLTVFLAFGGLADSQSGNATLAARITAIFIIIGFVLFIIRFYIFEVPLAIENNIHSTSTISRSWELTKGFIGRILLISFVALLITLPLFVLVRIISINLHFYYAVLIARRSILVLPLFLLNLGVIFVLGAVQLPFNQAVKAVVYYDLRTRKESLDIKLRDRNI